MLVVLSLVICILIFAAGYFVGRREEREGTEKMELARRLGEIAHL